MGKRKGKDNVSGHGRKKESRNGNNGNSRANKGGNAKDGKASSTDKNKTKKGDGGGGRASSSENKLLWESQNKIVPSTSGRRGNNRTPSYLDKLKSGEKSIDNMRDAQQLFRILSRDYHDGKMLILKFDVEMDHVLKEAVNLLYPDMTEPMKLLAAVGDEALTQGVYTERTLCCYKTLYDAKDFMPTLTGQV